MAYTRWDTEGEFLGGNPLPPSEASPGPQPYSPNQEHTNLPPPPHCVPAVSILRCITFVLSMTTLFFEPAPPAHCCSYGPQWNAPTLHSSAQDNRYSMPGSYINDMARGHGVWADAQQSAPFTPAVGAATASIIASSLKRPPKV